MFPKLVLLRPYIWILINSGFSLLLGKCNEISKCFLDKLGRICLEESETRLEIVIKS